jgi:hypothetical protein
MKRTASADNSGMARFIAALLFFFIGNTHAQAQNNWDYLAETPERIIGILDLPDIIQFGCGPAPNRATARLFGTSSQNGPSVGTLYWHEVPNVECELAIEKAGGVKEKVPTLESGYEIPAAIVFERRGQWFRIRLKNGSAWIRHTDEKDFLPYPEVLFENLAHTMQTWNGILRATPGASARIVPLPRGWKALLDRQLSITVLGSRRVAGEPWLRIRLAVEGGCDQKYEGVTEDVEGWIPAYHTDRSTLAWFASRGC